MKRNFFSIDFESSNATFKKDFKKLNDIIQENIEKTFKTQNTVSLNYADLRRLLSFDEISFQNMMRLARLLSDYLDKYKMIEPSTDFIKIINLYFERLNFKLNINAAIPHPLSDWEKEWYLNKKIVYLVYFILNIGHLAKVSEKKFSAAHLEYLLQRLSFYISFVKDPKDYDEFGNLIGKVFRGISSIVSVKMLIGQIDSVIINKLFAQLLAVPHLNFQAFGGALNGASQLLINHSLQQETMDVDTITNFIKKLSSRLSKMLLWHDQESEYRILIEILSGLLVLINYKIITAEVKNKEITNIINKLIKKITHYKCKPEFISMYIDHMVKFIELLRELSNELPRKFIDQNNIINLLALLKKIENDRPKQVNYLTNMINTFNKDEEELLTDIIIEENIPIPTPTKKLVLKVPLIEKSLTYNEMISYPKMQEIKRELPKFLTLLEEILPIARVFSGGNLDPEEVINTLYIKIVNDGYKNEHCLYHSLETCEAYFKSLGFKFEYNKKAQADESIFKLIDLQSEKILINLINNELKIEAAYHQLIEQRFIKINFHENKSIIFNNNINANREDHNIEIKYKF